MRSPIFFAALSAVVLCANIPQADAALVFAINGQEGTVPAITLSQSNPSANLLVQVRRDDSDSGGSNIAAFAFRVRSSDPTAAQFTSVALSNPANLTGSSSAASGATATATGTFIVRPPVFSPVPGVYVDLATFTLTGINPGSTNITIEELTVDVVAGGPNDFLLGALIGQTVGQDRTGFSGDGTVIGSASTSILAVSTVPEPGSILLCCGGLAIAGFVRSRKQRSDLA